MEWGWKSNLSIKDDRFKYLASDTAIWQEGILVPFEPVAAAFDFTYREDVHAIYSTLGRKYGVYGVQGGLRLEQVFTEALWEGDQSFSNDYSPPIHRSTYQATQRRGGWIATTTGASTDRAAVPSRHSSTTATAVTSHGQSGVAPRVHQQHGDRTPVDAEPDVHHDVLVWKITNDIIQRYSSIDEQGIRTSSWINQGQRLSEGLEIIAMAPFLDAARP